MFFCKSEKDSRGFKSYKEKWFSKKLFKPFHDALATKQWQNRCLIVSLFCLQKEHWQVSDIPKEKRFLFR